MSAVPEPRDHEPARPAPGGTPTDAAAGPAATADQPQGGARRALALALLSGTVGAALALLAGGQTWSRATTTAAQGAVEVTARGGDVSGLPAALAVVGLAALVAVFAVRGAGRSIVAALLTLCGVVTVATAVLDRSGTSALEAKAARTTGLVGAGVEHITYTAWPWVAAAGGILLLLAGLLALRHGRLWPAMSGRYERPGRPAVRRSAAPDPERPEELWKALDRGEDPTREG